MSKIHIVIYGDPPVTTQKNTVRFCKKTGHTYHTKQFTQVRNKLHAELLKQAPKEPLDGPLKLTLLLFWKPPANKKKAIWRNTKPDCDNSLAVVADQLEKCGFVVNDSRFAIEHVEKHYSTEPRMEIIIEKL